jgi:hypothetical protein
MKCFHSACAGLLALLGALLLAAAMPAIATAQPAPSPNYDTNYRLIFPKTATAPTIDGTVLNEAAWNASFNIALEDGGETATANLRGMYDNNFVYLYAETETSSPGFKSTDVLVIGINGDNGANYHLIQIFPCALVCSATGTGQTPQLIFNTATFNGTTYSWGADSSNAPSGFDAKVGTATAGTTSKWSVEVKIPRAAYNIVDTNFFGLLIDVMATDPAAGPIGTSEQFAWPPYVDIGGTNENQIPDIENGMVPPKQWANATLSTAFGNGVSLQWSDITTNQPNPRQISLNLPNIFTAVATNTSSSGGTPVTARQVKAAFTIANFGLANAWAPIPDIVSNQTSDIQSQTSFPYQVGPWTLTAAEKAAYNTPTTLHQCLRVDLTSTDPGTMILTPSVQVNMDFVDTHSPFSGTASITLKRFPKPEGKETNTCYLRESTINVDPRLEWTSKLSGLERGRNGRYRIEVVPDKPSVLNIEVQPPPSIKLPKARVRLPAGTGGRKYPPVQIKVEPNDLITFVADGTLLIGKTQVTAGGASPAMLKALKAPVSAGRGKFLDPNSNLRGAVVGSFDGFKKTAFVIGASATIKVPEKVRALWLAINDTADGYAGERGEGFNVQIVKMPLDRYMLAANPDLARPVSASNPKVALGANLPTWQMRGGCETTRFVRIGRESFRSVKSIGSFGYMVKSTN